MLEQTPVSTASVSNRCHHALQSDETTSFDRILYLYGYVLYLYGYPIKQSLSPLLHQIVYAALNLNWAYTINEQREIATCLQAMQYPKFHGAAVTMPYNVTIMPYLDRLTPQGRSIGAVNTIFIRDENGRRITYGTNTDCVGIKEAILQNAWHELLVAAHGRLAMVFGGGGTSQSGHICTQSVSGF